MNRLYQLLLIGSTIAFSWLAMMAIHELGHVLHLWFTGGTVDYVVLHPLAISYTHPGRNPHPWFVAWGGVIWGCALPLVALGVVRLVARPWAYLPAFFAGFCLTANGAYLVGDALVQGGDGGDLVAGGAPAWLLVALGAAAIFGGLRLWNGLGPHFGLGPARGTVDRRAAVGVTAALVLLLAVEVLWLGG